ncbi:MAG: hypothetical protein KAT05_00625, partial [Spirochaetes bacterium]|nr:hypothetical protein [Spirochaetota bacterium]
YRLDVNNGFIKFLGSVYGKTVLIFYQANINGTIYNVGASECGRGAIWGTDDFDKNLFPNYFVEHDGKDYLILNFFDDYTFFEEKNSYRIAGAGTEVTQLNADILNDKNERKSGYKISYDEYTGCMRIIRAETKADKHNIYPFYDADGVDGDKFYGSFFSPGSGEAKHIIDYSCYIHGENLKLSAKPIKSSVVVYLNSILLDPSRYSYDFVSQSIALNFEASSSDIIEVSYITDEEESFNITAVLKNDFRLNKYLILGDSFWYKMPIRLWEESYYFRSHSIEFLYNIHLKGDFRQLLKNKKSGKLEFNINAGFSLYYPELKGLTIVDDFEYELKGYKLNLHYINWYPVALPDTVYPDLNTASYGRIFFRNMHKYGIIEGSNFISIKDADAPNKEDYTDGASIGPYSSSDGFTYDIADKDFEDKTNTLSLVTEFELDANEAVSIVFPVSAAQELIDFSEYNGLNVALKRESLTGDLRLYIDAGKVTERFDPLDSTIQKEILDDGLKYLITDSGSFYLYKGKNDGINSTNDLDGNGLLDTDSSSDITRLIDSDTSSDYVTITEKYNNLSFLIKEPEKLKTMRGIRITLYSPTGASGRLIFNQLRFIESGWQYDNIGGSDAAEISPIEDSFLLDHIFSEENPEIDTKLHYQRFKERTLRINLKQADSFYIQKRFGYPIDIANYKKLSFFILLKEKTRRRLKLTLTDTSGNMMNDTIALDDLSKHKWHKLTFLFDSFDGYNRSNKLISDIKIDFENEGLDTDDNTIYIDEIYLDEANVSFGFATKNEFIYSEPQLDIKKNDFSIFQSPYIKWLTSFNTANFLIEELTPYRDYKFNNKLTISFRLTELDYHFYSSLDFIFRDNL